VSQRCSSEAQEAVGTLDNLFAVLSIQILRQLKHENIIEMLDAFESPQEFCVVTEFGQVRTSLTAFCHQDSFLYRRGM